jgi:hypothetical protein
MILAYIMLRLYKAAAVLTALMKVYSIPCHDRGHINVMLVLQSCTDSLQVMADSSTETLLTSSDGTDDGGNMKVEEDTYMPDFEEVNVKTEKVIDSEEVECIDIKDEDSIDSEEEKEEEDDIDRQEEEDVEIEEEVSFGDTLKHEINAEPDFVIYMTASPLLEPLQKYLEITFVFGLSIYTATANS